MGKGLGMSDDVSLTRRSFVSALLCMPSGLGAAPLIDLNRGGGLFSGGSESTEVERSMLNLYNDEAPTAADERQSNGVAARLSPFKVRLKNANTDERLVVELSGSRNLDQDENLRLSYFLRDWREDEVQSIDLKVLDDLMAICGAFAKPDQVLDVRITSGYRTLKTNEMLRQKSNQVARNSLHMEGKAIDFSLPNTPTHQLSTKAREICGGGVGTYRTFVHIDSGVARRWAT
jgi:uncharacterized protein YcbK (DUF882 family)